MIYVFSETLLFRKLLARKGLIYFNNFYKRFKLVLLQKISKSEGNVLESVDFSEIYELNFHKWWN